MLYMYYIIYWGLRSSIAFCYLRTSVSFSLYRPVLLTQFLTLKKGEKRYLRKEKQTLFNFLNLFLSPMFDPFHVPWQPVMEETVSQS